MTIRDTDTRAASLVDIPLVRRLIDQGAVLDSELEFTRDANGALVSSILLPQRGLCTLIARAGKQQVVGQFRLRQDDPVAHIMYIAPYLEANADDTAWLHVLDAMAREAGRHHAHALLAEVDENGSLFETMRTAGYAVYARQEIWVRYPGEYQTFDEPITLTEETEADALGIQSLLNNTVPSLVQQYSTPHAAMTGLVYRKRDRVEAYIAYSEGKHGVYIIPYLHPDVMSEATAILDAALRQIGRAQRLPVYVCVRRYQDWIMEVLAELRFEPCAQQAVMVKHITAGVRHATFAPLQAQLEHAPSSAKPPTSRVSPPVVVLECLHDFSHEYFSRECRSPEYSPHFSSESQD